MPVSLSKEHRKLLEKTTTAARILTESACRAALENLAVHEKSFWAHMSDEQKKLRNRLRARGRALGDRRDRSSNIQEIQHLTEAAAYEHWHRLLFTRFLTENNLLITDEANGNVPVTLEECEELAPELDARDGLDLACRFASRTLPGVFRRGDPVLDLPIALDDQVEMRRLLAVFPSEVFRSDDALGWTYQFWQAQRKNEVNKSGKKIGADEIAPVTQLFTEDYMVEFLLHNTIGAWWAGKLGPIQADTEEEARTKAALPPKNGAPGITWTYLRFVQDETTKTWRPAAGTFDGWPRLARLIRLLDPCMGSGHFLVFALPIFVRLRMEEENLTPQAAVVAVLKDNIHGLEIDERCTQIAAFNVALTAWKLAGYQPLPNLNLACSGLAPCATEEEWVALAGENDRLQRGMARLYNIFTEAPVLGTLINPHEAEGNLIEANMHQLSPLLAAALRKSENQKSKLGEDSKELVVVAQGLVKAGALLLMKFTLVITNVPFLAKNSQSNILRSQIEAHFTQGSGNLAMAMVERCRAFCSRKGTYAVVTIQDWMFLNVYESLRMDLLAHQSFDCIVKMGAKAFSTQMWDFNTILLTATNSTPSPNHLFIAIDLMDRQSATEKANKLASCAVRYVNQAQQIKNPGTIIIVETTKEAKLLKTDADSYTGVQTGDDPRYRMFFWEIIFSNKNWRYDQGTVGTTLFYGGRQGVLRWENEGDVLRRTPGAYVRGEAAWGKRGVAVSQMQDLPVSLYDGECWNMNCAVIIPKDPDKLPALWAFCSSETFVRSVRSINQALKVNPGYFLKVPVDLRDWKKLADNRYLNGLPKPQSDDPTQWLFNGHPKGSDQPLHVAVARLLGYRWPRQTGSSFPDCPALGPDGLESFADKDGIVCLPPLSREQPAAARLRQLLTAALGTFDERALIASAGLKGSKSKTLEDWLRDEFFAQHAKLFHNRPFIWHLWDGRPDGFHALVNYHKLDYATLQKLTYSYLGNWIQQQEEDTKADKPGAADRLGAARKLQARLAAILEGDAPLDIFVRWKPIKDQAQGWHRDLNDGIRQNIRPFLLAGDVGKKRAGLFRAVPLKLKDKDRGKEPHRSKKDYPWFWCEEEPGSDPMGGEEFVGARWNNVHLTLARKKETTS